MYLISICKKFLTFSYQLPTLSQLMPWNSIELYMVFCLQKHHSIHIRSIRINETQRISRSAWSLSFLQHQGNFVAFYSSHYASSNFTHNHIKNKINYNLPTQSNDYQCLYTLNSSNVKQKIIPLLLSTTFQKFFFSNVHSSSILVAKPSIIFLPLSLLHKHSHICIASVGSSLVCLSLQFFFPLDGP